MTLPKIGKPVPAFTLEDQHGKRHALKDYRGKTVVLYFYPKAMTPGCTVQACGIRDSRDAFSAREVEVLGVSPDPAERLAKFEERDKLNFTLLSDPDHAVAEEYGAWGLKKFMGREYMGVKRMTFIIDGEGKLRHIMEDVKTKTHHDDVLNIIEARL